MLNVVFWAIQLCSNQHSSHFDKLRICAQKIQIFNVFQIDV